MKRLLAILLIILPFVYTPWVNPSFETPKVWLYQRFVELFIIVGLILSPRIRKLNLNIKIIGLCSFFVVWATFTSLTGVNFLKSFWGNYSRSDGLFTLYHHLGFMVILSLYWQKRWLPYIKNAVTVTAVGISIWILAGTVLNNSLLQLASFGHPAFLSIYLSVLLPLLPTTWLPLIILSILSTKAISGYFGIFLFMLLKIFAVRKVTSHSQIVLISVVSVVIGLAVLTFRDVGRSQFDNRQRIITKGIIATWNRPVIGWGLTNFDYAFESVDWPMKLQHDIYYDKPHSNLLEVLTTTGLIGLAIYAAIQIQVIKVLSKIPQYSSLFQMYILFVVLSQTNVYSIDTEIIYWMLVAISVSAFSLARPKMASPQKAKNRSR